MNSGAKGSTHPQAETLSAASGPKVASFNPRKRNPRSPGKRPASLLDCFRCWSGVGDDYAIDAFRGLPVCRECHEKERSAWQRCMAEVES